LSITQKIDVLEILLDLLREHEEKLDSLIEKMEIVDKTIKQDPILKKALHEYDPAQVDRNGSQNILVVDDDKSLAATFKFILEGVGYIVDAAYTGGQALSMIDLKDYDLILLDLNLPDMMGDEVAEKIEKKSKWTDIVFITGYSMLKDSIDRDENERKILMKPINPEELVRVTNKKLIENARAQ
jgi:CheY-like chemotaxis protein